jgi:fibronectin type 3 domain-containing protein
MRDRTLGDLTQEGEGWTLRYGVRVLDARGRPSPLVVARDLSAIRPLPAPAAPTAEASGEGVRLRWSPPADLAAGLYNVSRAEGTGPIAERPRNSQPLQETEFLDADVTNGVEYTYLVRAAAAGGPPFRESASSPTVTVLAVDRQAPAPPRNLVAVQEGSSVRLFWDPSPEPDVAGYRVYRGDAGGSFVRVGGERTDRPLYLDASLAPGRRVAYRVTAVDRADPPNESEPSDPVEFELGAEPPREPAEGS